MPIIKSAQKKLRQDKVRTRRNVATKKAYKIALKGVTKREDVSEAHSKIDKAAKQHLIHPHKAARLKARVSKLARGTK